MGREGGNLQQPGQQEQRIGEIYCSQHFTLSAHFIPISLMGKLRHKVSSDLPGETVGMSNSGKAMEKKQAGEGSVDEGLHF